MQPGLIPGCFILGKIMGNHAEIIKEQNSGLAVSRKGRNFIEFELQNGKKRFVSAIDPLHTRTTQEEIDTTWIPDTGAWQWKIAQADFQAHARSIFNVGNLIEWRHESGEWVIVDPQSISWINQDNSNQQIAIKQAVTGIADDMTLTFLNAYGNGLHFSYTAHPKRLIKHFTVDSPLPDPAAWLTGTIWLEVQWSISNSDGVELWLDGVRWTRENNVRVRTSNSIEFRSEATGEVLWYADAPMAIDANGEAVQAQYEVHNQNNNYFIRVRVPREWLETAIYPVVVDPTFSDQPDATAGVDTRLSRDFATVNYGTTNELRWEPTADAYAWTSVLKFDLSELEGVTITDGTLSFWSTALWQWNDLPTVIRRILPANSTWTETGACWNYTTGTTPWAGAGTLGGCSVEGTDYSATALGSYSFPANSPVGTECPVGLDPDELEVLVGANHGFVVLGTAHTDYYFASSDHATAGYRPLLVVEYTDIAWVSPASGTDISNTPTFVLTPAAFTGSVHIHMQLDTADSFDTGNLREIKTNASTTGWEYWDGDSWEPFPSTGLPDTYSGNDVRYTVQSALSEGTWYRRVRQG